MRKKIKYIFLFLQLMTLTVHTSYAQDFKKDYSLMQEAYLKLDKFYCEINVKLYESGESSTTPEQIRYIIKKQADDFWYSMGKIKMVVNNKCVLYINEDTKEMIYSARDKKNEMKLPMQNAALAIDSLLKKSDSVVFAGVKNNYKKYLVYSGKSVIVRSELLISQTNYLIGQVTYYYDTKKSAVYKAVIEYVNMNLLPQFFETDFSEKKYAIYSNKTLKPVSPYTEYKATVIDQKDLK